jgi:hypothetical protein
MMSSLKKGVQNVIATPILIAEITMRHAVVQIEDMKSLGLARDSPPQHPSGGKGAMDGKLLLPSCTKLGSVSGDQLKSS